jgi:hypothetical protein
MTPRTTSGFNGAPPYGLLTPRGSTIPRCDSGVSPTSALQTMRREPADSLAIPVKAPKSQIHTTRRGRTTTTTTDEEGGEKEWSPCSQDLVYEFAPFVFTWLSCCLRR